MSSGHKVAVKIVAELTADISGSEPTLVLFNEPETHLEAPPLAAFLKSVHCCLETFDGYAIKHRTWSAIDRTPRSQIGG